jgi:two-component system, chemotaxis family, response regulator Rcp1
VPTEQKKPEILLVDDNPADLDLFREALGACDPDVKIHTVPDGEEAIAFLYRSEKFQFVTRPDLVVLDLNLPRKSGRAVLAVVKCDPALRTIPILVFTTSGNSTDINDCYDLGANCYVSKPDSLSDFRRTVHAIEHFWLTIARLSS